MVGGIWSRAGDLRSRVERARTAPNASPPTCIPPTSPAPHVRDSSFGSTLAKARKHPTAASSLSVSRDEHLGKARATSRCESSMSWLAGGGVTKSSPAFVRRRHCKVAASYKQSGSSGNLFTSLMEPESRSSLILFHRACSSPAPKAAIRCATALPVIAQTNRAL